MRLHTQRIRCWLITGLCTVLPAAAQAAPCEAPAPACAEAAPCQPAFKMVERTVMVPQMVTENRTVQVIECQAEHRQHKYTAYRNVVETRDVQCEIVVPRMETRMQEVEQTVYRPVMATETRQCTVMVPVTETRQATRKVCRMVPVVETRTVCEDQGCWQSVVQTYKVGCGDCAQTCCRSCNVWVPKIVSRQVQTTVMKPKVEEVAYTYNVTVCKPEVRTTNVQVCTMVRETVKKQVAVPFCVQEKKVVTRQVVTCRPVAEERVCDVVVQVPHTVERQVAVQVCKMVPKTVTCKVPVDNCQSCAPASAPCRRCW